jgi:hypothetical protein
MGVNSLVKALVKSVNEHKPEIMIGVGLAAGAGAIFVAVKETPACLEAFDKAKEEIPEVTEVTEAGEEVTVKGKLGWKKVFVIYAKYYGVAAALELMSIFLIVFGCKIKWNTCAYIAALCGATKAELDDLKQVIAEQPESWRKKFTEKVSESHINNSDPATIPEPCMTNTEVPMPKPLRWDDHAKVYYRKTDAELSECLAEYTHMISSDPFNTTTMNDWMRVLDHEEVAYGDQYIMTDMGEPLKYRQVDVKTSPTGEPAIVMKFSQDYKLDTRGLYSEV